MATIGRGFSPNLPIETARAIRAEQRKGRKFPKYDIDETREELHAVLGAAGIGDYRIETPRPEGAEGVNYGIWVEFRKPALSPAAASPPGRGADDD